MIHDFQSQLVEMLLYGTYHKHKTKRETLKIFTVNSNHVVHDKMNAVGNYSNFVREFPKNLYFFSFQIVFSYFFPY